jgi:hypothetical protein
MQMLRIGLVLLAAAACVGQYLQERYRLTVIEKLPGKEALAKYEAQRKRSERSMTVLTVAIAIIGLAALVDLVTGGRLGR